jgi:hypothetical protein
MYIFFGGGGGGSWADRVIKLAGPYDSCRKEGVKILGSYNNEPAPHTLRPIRSTLQPRMCSHIPRDAADTSRDTLTTAQHRLRSDVNVLETENKIR